MTRTLQTAVLIAEELGVGVDVEVGFREWDSGSDGSAPAFAAAAEEFRAAGGEHAAGHPEAWESREQLRSRTSEAVARWRDDEGVLVVVTHAFVVEVLTGRDGRTVGFCEVVVLE